MYVLKSGPFYCRIPLTYPNKGLEWETDVTKAAKFRSPREALRLLTRNPTTFERAPVITKVEPILAEIKRKEIEASEKMLKIFD